MDFATIPFSIRIGGKEYIDDEGMPVSEMLEMNETHAEIAQTACPSPETWREKFSAPASVAFFAARQQEGVVVSHPTDRKVTCSSGCRMA